VQLLGCSRQEVATQAAKVLRNLAHHSNSPAIRSVLVEAGSIPALVQLLRSSQASSGAQQAAADALRNLTAGSASMQMAITAAGWLC